MKKRVFAMLLAMAMVFSLMACGSKDKAGGSDGGTIRLGGVGPLHDQLRHSRRNVLLYFLDMHGRHSLPFPLLP